MNQNQHSMKEKIQYRYMSASLALAELKELGYTIDYNVEKEQIKRDTSNFDITYIFAYSFAFIFIVILIEKLILNPLEKKAKRWR